jgi:hypothetical protein
MSGGYLYVIRGALQDENDGRIWSRLLREVGNVIEELAPRFGFESLFIDELLAKERCGLEFIDFTDISEDEFNGMYRLLERAHATYQNLRATREWSDLGASNRMWADKTLTANLLGCLDSDERFTNGDHTLLNPKSRERYVSPFFYSPPIVYFNIVRRLGELAPHLQTELFKSADGESSQPAINYLDMSGECFRWVRGIVVDIEVKADTEALFPIFYKSNHDFIVEQGRVFIKQVLQMMRYDERYKK